MPTITQNTKDQITLDVQEELYYIYYNWRAHQDNKIHIGTCNICKYGFGMRNNQIRGRNGVWIGPFTNMELVNNYLQNNGLDDIPPHDCID